MFVPYDSETGQYINNNRWDRNRDDYWQSATYKDARQYKRRHAAIEFASLRNVTRNVPLGRTPNKHYQNRPQVEIHEIDDQGRIVRVYNAPPQYIYFRSK